MHVACVPCVYACLRRVCMCTACMHVYGVCVRRVCMCTACVYPVHVAEFSGCRYVPACMLPCGLAALLALEIKAVDCCSY